MRLMLLIFALMSASQAFAHAHLKASAGVAVRDPDATSIKVGPCGGRARVASPAILTAGQTLTVTWEETINHPGRYEFYFSQANDQNWVLLKTVPDTQDSGTLPHQYSTTVVLPSTPCTACTLQLIQVMTENPASPSNYYSCSDIVLQAAASSTPTPQSTPALTSDIDCKVTPASLTK